MVGEGSQQKKKAFYVSMQRIQCKKNTTKFFYLGKGEDMVRRLGTGPGLILERELAKNEQGDSDAERTADREQTNQMKAP
jgi:hypothetical protein